MSKSDNLSLLSDLEPGRTAVQVQDVSREYIESSIEDEEREIIKQERARWGDNPPPDYETWQRLPESVKWRIWLIALPSIIKDKVKRFFHKPMVIG